MVLKKLLAVLAVLAAGSIAFGYLPKSLANRVSRALLVFFLLAFMLRVGAYYFQL